MKQQLILLCSLCLLFAIVEASGGGENDTQASIHVASWRFDYVKYPFIISGFIVGVAAIKIVFHHLTRLAEHVPESCMLILFGIAMGLLFRISGESDSHNFLVFNSKTFFLFLLPPIILESAYSLRDRAFYENIGTILLYAVIGTVLNIILISVGLFSLDRMGAMGSFSIGVWDYLIFASLIAAVDPVAVLAIFQEVGVNKMLYFMVFGESLLNDAVTVVMYNLMIEFKEMDSVGMKEIGLGFAAFLCVALGGALIGLVFGFISAFMTKFTAKIRVTEPVILFGTAYLAYLSAELFHFSGIISIIVCGLNQAQYACENISSKSYISVHYFSKVASSVMESLIFIILGVMLVVHNQNFFNEWHTGFAIYALILCFLARAIVVFSLTLFVNKFMAGVRKITTHEQFIMTYGGLRGAVSFSLAFMLTPHVVPARNTFLCAAYLIILFTVFVQGSTMKPLVRLLRITLASSSSETSCRIFKEFQRGLLENMMSGMEEIIGYKGTYYWTALAKWVSQHFIRPAVQKYPGKAQRGKGLVTAYQEDVMLKKLDSFSSAETPQQGSLWDELQLLDKSTLPASFSDVVLDAQDRHAAGVEKSKDVTRHLRLDRTQDFLKFKDIIRHPMYKTVMYDMGDKNLKSDPIRRASDVEHLLRVHKAYREVRRRRGVRGSDQADGGPKTSYLLARALTPVAAGIALTSVREEEPIDEAKMPLTTVL